MTIPYHIIRNGTAILISLAAVWSCKDKYVSPYKAPATGYLVVDGYISGNSATTYTLSRSIPLPGGTPPKETGANVDIEGSDGSLFPLPEQSAGIYSDSNALPLNTSVHYRLRIRTSNGEQYLSDTVPYKITPPIDSLNFINGPDGTTIYANTHDPAGHTRFYLWNYDQTFEYLSAEPTYFYWDTARDQVTPRPDTSQVYYCWLTGSRGDILTATSNALASDVIYEAPLLTIPPNNVQLSVLYTMLARQYALTDSGYQFYHLMQQNTETLGSIFDAQPSALTGNIHCLSHPEERVIGWISAGTVTQFRIWISRAQVPSTFEYKCPISNITVDPSEFVTDFGSVYTPIALVSPAGAPPVYSANYTDCLVCTLHGGDNHPPSFWPK